MKKVIVTGPTGAIGVALIENLIKEGNEVLAVCRKGSKRISNIPSNDKVQILELDLSEISQLPQKVTGVYDVFYHLAWDGTFGDSRNDMEMQLRNIQYTLNAVETASRMGCKTFVGAGSQAEYGRVEGKLSAKTPAFPENGYGIAKLSAGQMSKIRCEQLGIKHIWTRILSVYGPYDGEKTMVMSMISKLHKGETPSLTKGEQEWDYLYSMDAGKAMLLIGEKGVHGKIYCIGSGKVDKLANYMETIKKMVRPEAELGIGEIPYAKNQVMYLCADITDLKQDTGFEPQYTFEEGIRATYAWYKEQKNEES